MFFRERHRPPAAFQRGADGDYPGNARFLGATEYFRQVLLEVWVIQVRVGVSEHCENEELRMKNEEWERERRGSLIILHYPYH